ncbi:MAG: anthranilate synthase component I [Candidatus Eisenbacteria bacterium]|uniref:Anthranilate synthase component 1 n=1 Tax=Eiseniibacteriota bacterium TaxID=2212470 RepID=A0A956SE90_UNCEI|nr:anthranilate synthase component I [Candidatus Eisenbacteria bacterium]
MITPTREEFRRLARTHDIVPVHREILADEETPVSAFRKLDPRGPVALLESIEGDENWGRYSMIALDPRRIFESRGCTVRILENGEADESETDDPMARLQDLVRLERAADVPGLPRMTGGAVGFGSYDLVRSFERLPETAKRDLDVPDSRFVFFDTAVLFDHQFHTLKIVVNARPSAPGEVVGAGRSNDATSGETGRDAVSDAASDVASDAAYDAAVARIEEIEAELARAVGRRPATETRANAPAFESTMSKAEYMAAVDRAKEYVRAGDIFQVVLAHRLEAKLEAEPFEVYRALRVTNPSPYMFFLDFGDLQLIGASPEVLVRREGDRVEVRPIAGTRPRGRTEAEDKLLETDLLDSQKERAEHVMLVDLGRNDVGRIADFKTVVVDDFMVVERYSHVMHIVSNVRGHVPPERGNDEILAACFPAGTVSGAPKIRAMEIIEELEPVRRGIYAGAVGYLDLHGNMDTCIAIRTLWMMNGTAYLGVGAGIVADSDPEAEYLETMNKGSAILRACELAERGLHSFSRSDLKRRVHELPKKGETA